MNISTGGPQILLFERDQQLASLLTSELQLAGYGCSTARTAVEVFDSMARYPIKLVLINLAQAAVARREFWVALDTQRRGRGIQIFSFRCTNIASYGPLDLDELAGNITPDMEVDGMPGIIGLIGAVQACLPNSASTTMPRIASTRPTAKQASPTQSQQFQASAGEAPSRPIPSIPNSPLQNGTLAPTPTSFTDISPTLSPAASSAGSPQASSSYSEKIRAVLYPNQRNWNTGATLTGQTEQKVNGQRKPPGNGQTQFTAAPMNGSSAATTPVSPASTESNILQRLANGQADDSGLAQLSRMVQERRSAMGYAPPPPPPAEPQPMMRPAPIQDLPITRVTPTHETVKQPEVPVRSYQHIEPTPSAIIAPLEPTATLLTPPSMPIPSSPVRNMLSPEQTEATTKTVFKEVTRSDNSSRGIADTTQHQHTSKIFNTVHATQARETFTTTEPQADIGAELRGKSIQTDKAWEKHSNLVAETNPMTNNTILMDILQSLPPMPAPPPQPRPEPPLVLNGRATRALGNVLLAGHLVPEDRLDVAQQIQRMLSGVDLNYQLGEILLMFKLLTPDQLMAASLVSYGLINTTQISALGRIRQELHAIGLEYDLENLLIMFRILTPEQLREVKSSWQG